MKSKRKDDKEWIKQQLQRFDEILNISPAKPIEPKPQVSDERPKPELPAKRKITPKKSRLVRFESTGNNVETELFMVYTYLSLLSPILTY